jgi:3-hydroxyanthranilate 3,4-dioxygenase
MGVLASFNLMQWVEDNRELFRPPVLNQTVYKDTDFIIMVVGGPNVRTDYHVDPFEEFFYQLKGNMVLKVVDGGELRDVPIAEGNIFLLPPFMPHSPQRPEPESIGLVVERTRPNGALDAFEWYCGECATRVHRREVQLKDIVADLPPLFEEYYDNVTAGTCPGCGAPNPQKIVA